MKKTMSFFCGILSASLLCAEVVSATAEPVTLRLKDGTELTVQAAYDVEVKAQKPIDPKPHVVALMVKNNTGKKEFDKTCEVLASQVGSQIAGANVEVIDVEDTVFAMETLRPYDEQGRALPTQDERLKGDPSRMHLAANAGADYLLTVTLEKLTKQTRRLKDRRFGQAADDSGAQIVNETYKISASYRVADVYTGRAFDGGTLQAQMTARKTAFVEEDLGGYADDLEETLATEMAEAIREKAPTWREASLEKSGIPVSFTVLAYDMNNKPIYLPALKQDNTILNDRIPTQVAATVEVDGVARGTTGCTLRLSRGVHKVRFSREGYDDVTLSVVPSEGLSLSVSMRMTEQEYNRVKDSIQFMHDLTIEREQSQGEVAERLGHAKMLEQSGLQIKANELPKVMGSEMLIDSSNLMDWMMK